MGDLPFDKIGTGQPPFYNTEINYFGPILMKEKKISNGKNETVGSTIHLSEYRSYVPLDSLGTKTRYIYIITQMILFKKRVSTYHVK